MSIDWNNPPSGWKLVPIHPTSEMRSAAGRTESNYIRNRKTFYAGDAWAPMVVNSPDYPVQAWDGKGLPQVGTVCEIRSHKLNVFSSAIIKFAYRNVVVWDWEEEPALNGLCAAYVHDVEIRPLRTAEQIAEDERQQAIEQMIDDTNILTGIMSDRRIMAGQLYDAGYRKQEAAQ